MPIHHPNELKAFLASIGISPSKALSQNFLIDGNILRKIVQAAEIEEGDRVLEIGPGPGALTELLLEAGARVTAVEKDEKLATALERLPQDRLRVHNADILHFNLPEGAPQKVVGNLPYQITTPILTHLLPQRDLVDSVTVMVQEEVARRMVASPGNKVYGHLTLFLRFYGDPRYCFSVSRNCFYPPPRVDSAVVHIPVKKSWPRVDVGGFFAMTRLAFQNRRKMLRRGLRGFRTPQEVEQALTAIGKPVESRPEELSLEEFLALFEQLN